MNSKITAPHSTGDDQKTVSNQTMIEAINLALAHAMEEDPDVVMLGEDVGANGGVFRATVDLRKEFGLKRVMDTPLAETLISGITVGMACQGLKPVAEIQFMGFIYAAMEQIISHASRMRNRTRGRLSCPLVIRAPFGGGIHAPEHHCESTEALFAHIPGLRVVVPSSPLRAYGLLLSAIRNPDPVLYLEPKRIYRAVSQPVMDDGKALPLDTCFTLREGNDLTLISWGAMMQETLQCARLLADKGVDCEVIDVASISPLDTHTMECSVSKTGRCVIVHEAARSVGVGAEIAAHLAEHCLLDLRAPVKRVTGYDTIMPYFRNEGYYLPSVERILTAVEEVMAFG